MNGLIFFLTMQINIWNNTIFEDIFMDFIDKIIWIKT